MKRRPPGRRVAASFVCAASLLAIFPVVLGGHAGAADAPFTVTVDPVDLLGDGQLVTVTIKTTDEYPLVAAEMRICRLGPEYKSRKGPRPDPDFDVGGPNCPDKGISSSADKSLTDSTVSQNAATPAGSVSRYRVGAGKIQWTQIGGGEQSLTCGPQDPCALVVEARGGKDGTWTAVPVQLNFKEDDPIAGCGGPADGILLSGGSDRMSDAWVGWTLDDCKQEGRHGGTSRLVPTGEGPAVSSFANGSLDMVYTAAGYGDEVGLLDETVEHPRQAIAVPVAINAAVLGVFGGRRNETGVKVPYDDLRLSLEEVAGLLSAGSQGIQPHFTDVFARNPELDGNFFDTGNRAGFNVAAPAEAESTSWFATNHLLRTVPGAWKVPDQAAFGDDAGRARGADAALGVADPSYALSLSTLSGRPPLAKAVAQVLQSQDTVGGAWVLTDLETATALGMTVVKIANVDGDFVPVTPASVKAGVESMEETDNGLLLPDPEATEPVDGVTPYPLSFVEYVLVPAEPLVDAQCTARSDSQALLTSWLEYVDGHGSGAPPRGDVAAHAGAASSEPPRPSPRWARPP